MASRPKDFKKHDVRRALLWCARHCCLCGKQCGVGIELAHIDQNGTNDLDNGIPVCFDCHLKLGGYDALHPRGRKFGAAEIKACRDQVYEKQTSRLIPPVRYEVTQNVYRGDKVVSRRTFPQVGFMMRHLGGHFPVRAKIWVKLAQGKKTFRLSKHYGGTYVWNLNPGFGVNGWFPIPRSMAKSNMDIRARVDVVLIDIYDREHKILPLGFVLGRPFSSKDWYLEPSEDALEIAKPVGMP